MCIIRLFIQFFKPLVSHVGLQLAPWQPEINHPP
ncbi:hypothetical protein GECvBGOT_gp020 [Salmonella phage GEC_vB_GOT]|nr:hypothetical protein GECvBGOT_gp020 [Salmonella phage GEC_vB_GOT]